MADPIVAMETGIRQKGWFTVIYSGLKMGLIKTAKLTRQEYEESSFFPGGAFWAHKEAGPYKIGDVEIEKAVKADEVDDVVWTNFLRVMYSPPGLYQDKNFTVVELDTTRTQKKRVWTYVNAWWKAIGEISFEGGSAEPVLEPFTIACDYCNFSAL